uniref:Uncharacterized protein n=1 Tax=Anopheles melas TaxID=34690 RepID=A0A182U285_9DIPT
MFVYSQERAAAWWKNLLPNSSDSSDEPEYWCCSSSLEVADVAAALKRFACFTKLCISNADSIRWVYRDFFVLVLLAVGPLSPSPSTLPVSPLKLALVTEKDATLRNICRYRLIIRSRES